MTNPDYNLPFTPPHSILENFVADTASKVFTAQPDIPVALGRAQSITEVTFLEDNEYDYGFPLRFMAGLDQESFEQAIIEWKDPGPLTIEVRNTSLLELAELMTGLPLIPLCLRRLPAEGVE